MVPDNIRSHYLKWPRYYLDFCEKYRFTSLDRDSAAHFLRKLVGKKQPPGQQQQAGHAISLYYELIQPRRRENLARSPQARIAVENPGTDGIHMLESTSGEAVDFIQAASAQKMPAAPARLPESEPYDLKSPK